MTNRVGDDSQAELVEWAKDRHVRVATIPFVAASMGDMVERIGQIAKRPSFNGGLAVRLANAYCVALAVEDDEYRALLVNSGINLPDGSPVAAFMRLQSGGNPVHRPERVRGPSFFRQTLSYGAQNGLRHMFVGSDEETLRLLTERTVENYPGLQIVDVWSPPFRPLDDSFYTEVKRRIQRSSPDIVWVGMGTPKQDFASARIASENNVVAIGVGAAFNFVAGTIEEAPIVVQNLYLEWLYRLFCEPKRLWRRYLFGNLIFLNAAARGALMSRGAVWRGKQR